MYNYWLPTCRKREMNNFLHYLLVFPFSVPVILNISHQQRRLEASIPEKKLFHSISQTDAEVSCSKYTQLLCQASKEMLISAAAV